MADLAAAYGRREKAMTEKERERIEQEMAERWEAFRQAEQRKAPTSERLRLHDAYMAKLLEYGRKGREAYHGRRGHQ
jgi:hypothetical protein